MNRASRRNGASAPANTESESSPAVCLYREWRPTQSKVEDALEYSVAHNTEREAVIDRRALEATALQHRWAGRNLEQVRASGAG